MIYGKLTKNILMKAPKTVNKDGKVHYHPSGQLYAELGYLPVINTPLPKSENNGEPKYYTSHYEEKDGRIILIHTDTEPPLYIGSSASEGTEAVPDFLGLTTGENECGNNA